MNQKPKDSGKTNEDAFSLQVIISKLKHYMIAAFLFFSGFIILSSSDFTKDFISSSISISIGTSLITAAAVDVIYNMILIKNIDIIIAKHLMLTKEVQNEILKDDKRQEVLCNALEYKLGSDLKEAIKNSIDKLNGYKNRGKLKVELKGYETGSKELKEYFYQLNMIEECEEMIKSNKITIIATDNDEKYINESKGIKEDTYLFYLPSNLYLIENEFDFKTELIVNNEVIPKKPLEEYRIGDHNRFIKYEYEIGNNKSKIAQVRLTVNMVLSKMEHIFFWDLTKAYKNYDIDLDYRDTDIVKCEPYLPFSEYPMDPNFGNGRRILISINNWILPPVTLCFVWYCKNETPKISIIKPEAGSKAT
jgi:hypothetical protein